MSQEKITKEDLENKLRALQTGLTAKVEESKPSLLKVGGGIALLILIVVFLLGKRSGKHRSAIVEIRRF